MVAFAVTQLEKVMDSLNLVADVAVDKVLDRCRLAL
jgi:hypothetical protein